MRSEQNLTTEIDLGRSVISLAGSSSSVEHFNQSGARISVPAHLREQHERSEPTEIDPA